MTEQEHWESVYQRKSADALSWFRPHLEQSMRFVDQSGIDAGAPIIDVGGGASTFVDDLLNKGYSNITVLDISFAALDVARRRLGEREALVKWLAADIATVELPVNHYAFWNDRAVFHFLNDQERRRYVELSRQSLRPDGHIVVGTFGPDGPERCSGLPVVRFTAEALHHEFGAPFQKLAASIELHSTPWGTEQQFVYCCCKRLG